MKENLPSISLLSAFTPDAKTARSETLTYTDNLSKETGKIIDEMDRLANIREAESSSNSLEAKTHRLELIKSYMAYTAFRSNNSEPEFSKIWADAFTDLSIEVYGGPDQTLTHALIENQTGQLLQTNAPQPARERYMNAARNMGLNIQTRTETSLETDTFGVERARAGISGYLHEKYASTYEAMAINVHQSVFTPEDIAVTFERGLIQLRTMDVGWDAWKVSRKENKDVLSAAQESKSINVGMKRADATGEQVVGLFAHEVLRHALSALNGERLSAKLAKGLPDYLDFEEGMAVLYEYAMTGKLKDELIDRYTDIGIALGYENNGRRVPRSALLEYALAREELRNETRADYEKLPPETIQKKIYAHINRIYRGTPGNDNASGVFTKDAAYLTGFLAAGAYVESELENGKTIDEVIEYTSLGKFDPTNPEHAAYVAEVRRPQISQALVLYETFQNNVNMLQ